MRWVSLAKKTVNGSTGPPEESVPAPSRRRLSRLSRSTFAFLGVVFLGYLLSLGLRTNHALPALPPSREPAANSIAGIAGTELVSTRLNISRPQEPSPFRFAEIAHEAGIDFVHFSGMTEEKHFPTANGSGVAIFDYDGDGQLDLYFATGTLLPLGTARKRAEPALQEPGEATFRDVTEASGLGFAGFCHGIVVGDIDNDGDPDVFLCNYGPNVLFLNNGDGTFTRHQQGGRDRPPELVLRRGVPRLRQRRRPRPLRRQLRRLEAIPRTTTSAATRRRSGSTARPASIRTVKHILYRNNGDRTFTDVTDGGRASAATDGHGFGVVAADLNGDGLIDLYVANDMNPNFLFLNKGDGTFEDVDRDPRAPASTTRGQAQSGMGVDAEDVDGDGLPELFVTNFANEYNTLYQNLGNGHRSSTATAVSSAWPPTAMPWVGWGCALADFDNDGWPDCFVANGHVDDNRELLGPAGRLRRASAPVHRNLEGQRFRLATRDAGPYFDAEHVGRGRGVRRPRRRRRHRHRRQPQGRPPRPSSATTRPAETTGSA